jgi:hypothetical protein
MAKKKKKQSLNVGKHKMQGFTEHGRGSPLTGTMWFTIPFKESWH